jgi:adenosylmethionine-8-amino-7-oxononanoate aminotransferase
MDNGKMNRQISPFANLISDMPNVLVNQHSYINEFVNFSAIDTVAGGSAFILGYSNKEILDFISKKMQTISRPQIIYNHTSKDVEDINEFLCNVAKMSNIVWSNSGTAAVESAINIALNYMAPSGRDTIISIVPTWHGTSKLCLELNGITENKDNTVININAKRWSNIADRDGCEQEMLVEIEQHLQTNSKIAGIIFDPVPWISGSLEYSKNWWIAIRDLCNRYGVLMIIDDVALCYGKCNNWFSHLNHTVIPDIVAGGKAITAGHTPVGIAMCTNKIYRGMNKYNFTYCHTLQPYAGSVYAALKTVEIVKRDNLLEKSLDISKRLIEIGDYFKNENYINEYRVSGLFLSLDLNKSVNSLMKYGLTGRMYQGKKLNMCTPLIADDAYYDQLISRVKNILNDKL